MTHSELIEESEKLINWLDQLIDGLEVQADFRHRIAAGCLDITMEHQKAIVLLMGKHLCGSALSLMRLMVEAYVRGIWIHKCATERDLENFAKGNVPKFYELLNDVEKLESHEDKSLSRLKKNSWTSMNEFTHSGFQHTVRRQTETTIEAKYEDGEIQEAVNFANAFGCLAAIAICDLANNPELASTILDKIKNGKSVTRIDGTVSDRETN